MSHLKGKDYATEFKKKCTLFIEDIFKTEILKF